MVDQATIESCVTTIACDATTPKPLLTPRRDEKSIVDSTPVPTRKEPFVTYVIAEPCVDIKDKACIEECPVDCIYEGARMLYIHPTSASLRRL